MPGSGGLAAAEQTETSDGDAKERQRGRFRNRGRSAGAAFFDDRDIIEAVRVVTARVCIEELNQGRRPGSLERFGELFPTEGGPVRTVGDRIEQRAIHQELDGTRRPEDAGWIINVSNPKCHSVLVPRGRSDGLLDSLRRV